MAGADPSVLAVGAVCMDTMAVVDHFPSPDEKMRTQSLTHIPGGNAGNVCSNLARLGVSVMILGNLPCDSAGKALRADFDATGVLHSLSCHGTRTPSSFIIVDTARGSRTILHTPSDHDQTVEDLTEAWQSLHPAASTSV
eukprot:RCo055387